MKLEKGPFEIYNYGPAIKKEVSREQKSKGREKKSQNINPLSKTLFASSSIL